MNTIGSRGSGRFYYSQHPWSMWRNGKGSERVRNILFLPCGGLSCPSVSRRTSSRPSSLRGGRSLDTAADTLFVSPCSSLSVTSPFLCELTASSCGGGGCCDSVGMATASGGCWSVGGMVVVADVSIPVCVAGSL